DAEAATVEVVVEVDDDVAEIHQAAAIDRDRNSFDFESIVEFRIGGGVKIELVLEAAAAAADDAHAQIDLFRDLAGLRLFGDDPLDFTRRLRGDRNGHIYFLSSMRAMFCDRVCSVHHYYYRFGGLDKGHSGNRGDSRLDFLGRFNAIVRCLIESLPRF